MFLDKKLKRWVDAGLISAEKSSEIIEFEKTNSKSNALYGVLGVGAVSIIVGLISIVAANWEQISSTTKLTVDILWLLLIGLSLFKVQNKFLKEVLILVLFGSILGSIALIGQIYHLESHLFKSLSLWLVLGTPIMFFSESKYSAYIWAIVLGIWTETGYDYFFPSTFLSGIEFHFGYVTLVMFYAWMIIDCLKLPNPYFKKATFHLALFSGFIVYMIVGAIGWRMENLIFSPVHSYVLLGLSLPVSWYLSKKYTPFAGIIFFLSSLYLEFPGFLDRADHKVYGAIYFLVLWALLAYLGIKINQKRLFEFSCLIISLRIITIYYEVFSSLMKTGLGLISGGLFILFMVFLWHKGREKLWGLKK